MTPQPLRGRLATCSYRAFRPEMGLPVRITRGAPRWRLPYPLAGTVMRLAPTWPERKIEDPYEFVSTYQARLADLGVPNITTRLRSAFPIGTICLLCFEDLTRVPSDQWQYTCHRIAFAKWWEQETGDFVPELSDQPPK